MGQTPTFAVPCPELGDSANVPADVKALAERLDFVIGASRTFLTGMSVLIPGLIRVPPDDGSRIDVIPETTVPVGAGQTVHLLGVRHAINGPVGTSVTFDLHSNQFPVLANMVVDQFTTNTDLPVPRAMQDGERLQPWVTSIVGAPSGLSLTFYLEHTLILPA
ncbi:MAG TPA: hypothetical protein VK631_13400 [Solirubrobacteraceae bacterium]|nr:hypothetical protein [Solirubrobacteraceae bacterium]